MKFDLTMFKETVGNLVNAIMEAFAPLIILGVLLFLVIKIPNNLVKIVAGFIAVLYFFYGKYSEIFIPLINTIFN